MKILNKKAHFDYEITDKMETGIVLNGPETKSVFQEHVRLDDSYVKIIGNEIFVLNMQIMPYQFASDQKQDPKRTRKLLIHKKQIISLNSKLQQSNLTIIPLAIYSHGKIIKMEIGLGKGKKKWDKRETIKKREIERKIEGFKKN
jgi:SsrA-binding protein